MTSPTFSTPPAAIVSLAADLGWNFVTLVRTPADGEVGGYPDCSLSSPDVGRELKAVLRDRGVERPSVDGSFIIPERDIRSCDEKFDLFDARRFRALRPLARTAHAQE